MSEAVDLRERQQGFRRAFQFLCWEGAFAMAYETWIGPTYLSGVAGQMGVSIGVVSLLTAVPWLGAFGQLIGIWAYERAPSVKQYTLRLAMFARSLWAIPVLAAWFWGILAYTRGESFPANRWCLLTACVACTASLVASSSGSAWLAWVRELVPVGFRGRFFGVRQRYTMSAVIAAHALAFFWISWRPGGYYVGYAILLVCALFCAAMSTTLLSKVPRAEALEQRTVSDRPRPWLEIIQGPLQDRRFRDFLLFGAAFQGVVQMSGPYFPYYFTKELGIPMRTISIWTLLTHLGWLLASVSWGRILDRARGMCAPFWIAAHVIALSPALYTFLGPRAVEIVGPFDYFLSGIVWAGYTLAITTLQLKICPPGRSAVYFSVYSAMCGLSAAIGNLLGGQLALALQPWGGFRALFWINTCLRLAVIWALARALIRAAENRYEDQDGSRELQTSSTAG